MIKTASERLALCVAVTLLAVAAIMAAVAIYFGTSVDPFELLHNGSLNDTGTAGLVIIMFLAIPAFLFYCCIFICGGLAVIYLFTAAGLIFAIYKGDWRRIFRFNMSNSITSGLFAVAFGWVSIGLIQMGGESYEFTVATALLATAAAVALALCVLSVVCAFIIKRQTDTYNTY